MANTSCWYIPPEYGKIERLIEETGILPVRRGREEVIEGVPQREYRFRTVRECNYLMFRMYGWYYGQARGAMFPRRHYDWSGEIPAGRADLKTAIGALRSSFPERDFRHVVID
jgi:hypothetical protein